MQEILEMSSKERERYKVVSGVIEGVLTQIQAAELLGVTDRQIRNLVVRMRTEGARGLISKKRGRPSNNRLAAPLQHKILSIVQEKYHDFGPSLALEKLKLDGLLFLYCILSSLLPMRSHLTIKSTQVLSRGLKRKNFIGNIR
jgi:transposase